MKILYAEDDPAHFELTQRTLEDNLQVKFDLYHVDSLRGALKTLEMLPEVDLVLTDLRLPDGSGLDLLQKAKELQPPPAVILVTGQGDQQVAVTALKSGAADYLVKEGDYLHRLPAALTNAVAQNRLAREQAALRSVEQRFRVLVEQLPAAVYTSNDDETLSALYISPQISEISGYSSEEWLADPSLWLGHVHPEDLEAVQKEVKATHASRQDFNIEYRIIHRDGRVVWLRDYAKLILGEGGKPKYWQGILFDITKSVETQATLRASEERFRRIFHSTPIATCVVTVKDGRFIDANQAFQNLTGLSLEKLIGRTSLELGFWDSEQERGIFISQIRTSGDKGIETRYTDVPNGPRDTLAFYEFIELEGEPCLLSMFYDVTEQIKTQKALQSERDFALQVLNNMGQGLTVVNKSRQFEYTNPAYANMLGRNIEQILGKSPIDFTSPSKQANTSEEHELRGQGITSTYESILLHEDGHEVPVTITGVPRFQNGEISGAIAVITDLTTQKQTEQALERQVNELTTLHAVSQAEAESLAEDEVIEKVTHVLSQIYPEVCGILLLDPSGTVLTPHDSYRGADISNWKNGYPIEVGITGRSVTTGRIIRIGDITHEANYIEIASQIRSELCVPVRVQEHIIGVINIESRRSNAFTERDEEFLSTVASGLGTSLERLRLFDSEQKRVLELDTLYKEAESLREATAGLGASLELQPLLNTVLDSLEKIIHFDSAAIFLKRGEYSMEIVAGKGFPEPEKIVGRLVQPSTNWHSLLDLRSPFVIDDVQNSPLFEKWEGSEYVRGWMGIPMIARDEIIGFISLDSITPATFTERHATLAQTFANSIVVAIENSHLFEAEKRRRQEAETLRQASYVLSATLDPDIVAGEILSALKQIIPYDGGTVFLHEGEKLRIAMVQGYPHSDQLKNLTFPADDEFFQTIKTTRQPIIVDDAQVDPRFKSWGNSSSVRSWMIIPLISRNKIIGTITLDSNTPHTFDANTGDLAIAFAHQAAAAIDNARLYDETQRRLRELEIINRVSTSLRTTQSLEEMLPILLDEALLLVNTPHGAIWLYDHVNNVLTQRIARGAKTQLKHKVLGPTDGIVGHVFVSGEKYISAELKADLLLFEGNKDSVSPELSGICLPIKSTTGPVGVLMIGIEMKRQITEEINLLTILAEITGNAIHRAELFEHSQEQVHKLTTLRDIDSAIASSTDLRVTLTILMDHTLRHLKADAVDILLYHAELQTLTYLTSAGFRTASPSRPLMRLGEGLAGRVVLNGSMEHIADLPDNTYARQDPLLIREGFISYFGVPLIVKGQIKGVFEIFHRAPFTSNSDWIQFLHTLAGQAAIAIDNSQLFDNLQRSNQEIRQAYDTTLEGWARALELRDRETEGHTRRVTELTMQLAHHLGITGDDLVNIYRGVLLHDIGKMGVPDQILRKTGPLNESEWFEMRKHPEYAFNLLAPIPYLRPALDIPYCHHEHWDGSGYPRGLRGEQIPLSARIFSIVDIWDALLSDRPYRKAWPRDRVITYIKEISGKILDPAIVVEFIKMLEYGESKTGV